MLRLLEDKQLYAKKCAAAERVYAAHPTWEDVAQSWLSVAEQAVRATVPTLRPRRIASYLD